MHKGKEMSGILPLATTGVDLNKLVVFNPAPSP